MTHSAQFIYGYMVSDIWYRATRKETRCHQYMGYSFRLAAWVLLYEYPTDRAAPTTAFVTLVVEQWLEPKLD